MALSYALSTACNSPVSTAITTTGANALLFGVEPANDGEDRTLWLSAIGAGAVPTAVTVDLEVSFDGQASWQKVANATGIALVAASVATAQKVVNFPSGVPFRLNATTVTLGSATSVTVWGVVN